MTDRNELVARLRDLAGRFGKCRDCDLVLSAADRIEQDAATIARLEAFIENDADWEFSAKRRLELFREQRQRAEAAEAKLARAVEGLREIARIVPNHPAGEQARAALARLKGGDA